MKVKELLESVINGASRFDAKRRMDTQLRGYQMQNPYREAVKRKIKDLKDKLELDKDVKSYEKALRELGQEVERQDERHGRQAVRDAMSELRRMKRVKEDVIDKSGEFKQRQSKVFQDKVNQAFADANDGIADQARMEKHVRDSIAKAVQATNKKFLKYRLELAPILKHFKNQPDYFIPMIFFLLRKEVDDAASGLSNEDHELAKNFAMKHGEAAEKILDEHMAELNKIKQWSDEQKWPAGKDSLSRYTKFSYAVSDIKLAKEGLKRLMSGK